MDIIELMEKRHSVREFQDKTIPDDVKVLIEEAVEKVNSESGLSARVFFDEPKCFEVGLATYGRFKGCTNYFTMIGKKDASYVVGGKDGASLDEACGYYGEQLVLKAQELGLNTCWVALTHGKTKARIAPDEKEVIVISLGYGATEGAASNSKKPEQVSDVAEGSPDWYKRGIDAALLAPTALNQQKFYFTLDDADSPAKVKVVVKGIGACTKIDLGIVKCHFELGAGSDNFEWA